MAMPCPVKGRADRLVVTKRGVAKKRKAVAELVRS